MELFRKFIRFGDTFCPLCSGAPSAFCGIFETISCIISLLLVIAIICKFGFFHGYFEYFGYLFQTAALVAKASGSVLILAAAGLMAAVMGPLCLLATTGVPLKILSLSVFNTTHNINTNDNNMKMIKMTRSPHHGRLHHAVFFNQVVTIQEPQDVEGEGKSAKGWRFLPCTRPSFFSS